MGLIPPNEGVHEMSFVQLSGWKKHGILWSNYDRG